LIARAVAPASAREVIVARDVTVRAGGRPIVDGANFAAHAGETVGLVGPNGAGKTTLLRTLAGLAAHSGEVILGGTPAVALSPRERARKLAYVPQDHEVHWPLSVRTVVTYGRLPHHTSLASHHPADAEAIERALAAAAIEDLALRSYASLSAGEKARVVLARALAAEPDLLLADEPTSHLDLYFQLQIMDILRDQAAGGRAVVVVLHDLGLAARFCDRIVLMDRGRIVADGPPAEVLTVDNIRNVYRVVPGYDATWDPLFGRGWKRLDQVLRR